MRRGKYLAVAAVPLMIMPALLLSSGTGAAEGTGAWTVMVYLDGDNNLEAFALEDLAELEAVGSNGLVNVVVLKDTYEEPASLLHVESGGSTVIADWGEADMGDPATLSRFISDAWALYPAERCALVMWDHGLGIEGLCGDDDNGYDILEMDELREALATAGLAFDVLMFHACIMGTVEVAHQVGGYADFVVFSQMIMYAYGFPYDRILADLVADPSMDGRELSLSAAGHYTDSFQEMALESVTISVYDMALVDRVAWAVESFGAAQVATMDSYINEYRVCRRHATAVNAEVDLLSYATLVRDSPAAKDGAVKSSSQAVVAALEDAIIYEWHTADMDGLTGAGIYFPFIYVKYNWSDYYRDLYMGLGFDEATGWADFLDALYEKG